MCRNSLLWCGEVLAFVSFFGTSTVQKVFLASWGTLISSGGKGLVMAIGRVPGRHNDTATIEHGCGGRAQEAQEGQIRSTEEACIMRAWARKGPQVGPQLQERIPRMWRHRQWRWARSGGTPERFRGQWSLARRSATDSSACRYSWWAASGGHRVLGILRRHFCLRARCTKSSSDVGDTSPTRWLHTCGPSNEMY